MTGLMRTRGGTLSLQIYSRQYENCEICSRSIGAFMNA